MGIQTKTIHMIERKQKCTFLGSGNVALPWVGGQSSKYEVEVMTGQRRRRLANITPILGLRLVLGGMVLTAQHV